MNEGQFKKKYQRIEKIGEGGFGEVYKAKNRENNKLVAVKQIIEAEDNFGGISITTIREISMLTQLNHPNIIKLIDVFYEYEDLKLKISLVFEYAENDLRKYLEENKGKLSLNQIKSIMYQILQAINYLHINRIFHRDIKPCNILLMDNGIVKLGDFGLARYYSLQLSEYTLPIQTLHYRAPEVCLGYEFYGPPVDIWGAGCILIEMMEQTILFNGDSEIDEIFKIFNVFGTPSLDSNLFNYPGFNKEYPKFQKKNLKKLLMKSDSIAIDLFEKMMNLDPDKRINAKNALLHSFFEGLDFSHLYDKKEKLL